MSRKLCLFKIIITIALVIFLYIFWFISWEDDTVIINLPPDDNCRTGHTVYNFTEGNNVTLQVKWEHANLTIKHGSWQIVGTNISALISDKHSHTFTADKSMGGIWKFKFDYLVNVGFQGGGLKVVNIDGDNYTRSECTTKANIVPNNLMPNDNRYIIIAITIAAVAVIIIIAQAAIIFYLKAKARKIDRHNNLSKKNEIVENNDTVRYCSDPGKKVVKATSEIEKNQDSIIYEAPNIELPDRVPIIQTPPKPPAITTMPRSPRPKQHSKIAPQAAMLAAALNNPARGPKNDHNNFQKSNQTDKEINVASRPKLPLPSSDTEDVYEEMETEENTYEPPPINMLPMRPAVPQKKVVPPKPVVEVPREHQKFRYPSKPAVTPKPQRLSPNVKPNNELEEAFRRRNNVMQIQVESIPEPGTSRAHSPKPKPPPPAKPAVVPPSQQIQEEIYYTHSNERSDSSDEEWTYEPLKPLNNYNNDMNIYNI